MTSNFAFAFSGDDIDADDGGEMQVDDRHEVNRPHYQSGTSLLPPQTHSLAEMVSKREVTIP